VTIDEGYVKYRSHWTPAPASNTAVAAELERWRKPLHEAGLIGHYADLGIGFGNLSMRCGDTGQFLISGTQTGKITTSTPEHYALVTAYDIDGNSVWCSGPVHASSEAMTHAAIYELDPHINAIVHVHSSLLWNRYRDQLPTTGADVPYGTPEMAREFARLYATTDFPAKRIAVMAGHDDGLISFGSSLEEAATTMLDLHAAALAD
jgi:ribulose-5-phosphate 4-epimerase/fuculose-1-phosphate aldolase